MNKYITMGIVGSETYTVPDDLEIPEFETESDLWNFIWDNDLEAEINFDSIVNTGLISIEDYWGKNILENYKKL